MYGGAQVMFTRPQRPREPLSLVIGRMQGDKRGNFFIGYNQSFLSLESYLPFNMVIYQGGVTTMQGELLVAGVTVDVDGILQNCQNITIAKHGVVIMKEMYDFKGRSTKVGRLSTKVGRLSTKVGRFVYKGRPFVRGVGSGVAGGGTAPPIIYMGGPEYLSAPPIIQ